MKIAFLTTLDPEDTNTWSGTSYHILQALCKSHDVKIVGQNMLIQTVRFTKENIAPKRDIREYSPVFGKLCAEEVTGCDLVFFGDLYLSLFLDTNIPIIHLSDVTYHAFKDYMHNDSKPEEIRQTEDAERKLLNKYNTIIYSSEWAKQSAVSYYGIDPSKIHVVEFGANIPHPCDYQINIDTNVCNLVFIGRNWEKKGGDKVLGTYRELKAMGMNCTLTIIGCKPPCAEDEGVVVYLPRQVQTRSSVETMLHTSQRAFPHSPHPVRRFRHRILRSLGLRCAKCGCKRARNGATHLRRQKRFLAPTHGNGN